MKPKKLTLLSVIVMVSVALLSGCSGKNDGPAGLDRPASPQRKWGPFALLVIDIQNVFWNDQLAGDFPDFPENVSALLNFCRSEGLDIIHLRARFDPDMSDWPSFYKLRGKIPCVKGSPGEAVNPFAQEAPGETVIYKHSFDGFLDTGLSDYLEKHNKKHLFIAGTDTGVCVITTCFSAFQKGYLLTLLEDCCAGEITSHKFITRNYNGFIFETLSFKNIEDNYPLWMERLNRLAAIEKGLKRQ
jgi:nicotinamidase-related amidase